MSKNIRITPEWREEPDFERLTLGLLLWAESLAEEAAKANSSEPQDGTDEDGQEASDD